MTVNSKIMDFNVGPKKVLLAWGLTVTLGWLATQILALGVTGIENINQTIMTLWLLLAIIPTILSLLWMKTAGRNNILLLWIILSLIGVISNYAVLYEAIEFSAQHLYVSLWFLAPAIGFTYTAYYHAGILNKNYTLAAIANIAALILTILITEFLIIYYTVAAVIQGLPILYHWNQLR